MAGSSSKTMLIFFFSLLILTISSASSSNCRGGFTVKLYNRDFSQHERDSTVADSTTFYDRVSRAVRRSNDRLGNYLRPALTRTTASAAAGSSSIVSSVIPSGGSYLMSLSLGSQDTKMKAIADTGSDLIWAQCSPCTHCYKQDDPLFDPRRSSSYRNLTCRSNQCQALGAPECGLAGVCLYSYQYGDGSHANGVLASETVTFDASDGSDVEIRNVFFGCGYDNSGTFNRESGGLVGLSAGSLSLIRQMESRIDSKFSYCLVPLADDNSTSLLTFGADSMPSGRGVVKTPLTIYLDMFYNLRLESITVGNTTIKVPPGTDDASGGNIIIDSGTTLTYLHPDVFNQLVSAVREVVQLPTADDPNQILRLCYAGSVEDDGIPPIYFQFSGAKVELLPINTFLPVDAGVICLGFLDNAGLQDLSIYGNVAQQNFRVGHDLDAMVISFAPTKCGA